MDLLSRVADRLLEVDRDSRLPWHDDPAGFAEECVAWPAGQSLVGYQAEIMRALPVQRRVAVRGPHGLGKSALAALTILWFSVTRDAAGTDWKVLSTASAWRQLEKFLWPEIHLWSRRLRWDLLGREPFDSRTELLTTMLKLRHGQAFAGASDDPGLLEGAHASEILVVLDEAKSIPAGTWEALEGAMSGPGESAYALAVSTPGTPSGTFFDIHSRKPGFEDWWTRHVSLEEATAAGRISEVWALARARQWGTGSAVYKNRVEGEFATSDEDGVIPLEWVEAANDRWRELNDSVVNLGPVTHLGVDVARSGSDKTVLALRRGEVVSELRSYAHADTMTTTGYAVAVLQANPECTPVVDVIGVGGGVVDRLREQGYKPVAFNASAGSNRKDRSGELMFVNTRAAGWWHLREALDPAYDAVLALPPDDLLTGDLVAPRYCVTSAGKIQVEGKDDIRKRLGRSTDSGDAVVQACFDPVIGQGAMFMELWRGELARQEGLHREGEAQLRHLPRLGGEERPVLRRGCQHRWRRSGVELYCVFCSGWKEQEAAA